jgi:beta-glucanase (GH16 family)
VRVRVPQGAKDYNAVALLWPSTDNWPGDGEVDFLELKNDATRHNVTGALHYSPDGQTDKWIGGNVDVDATQWHNYAVEWTPTEMTFYVDAVPYFTTTDVENFPSTAMQLCLQFDVAGSDLAGGGQMEVAWARMYSLDSITAV